ncbi:hypothetical protein CEXT_551991 [Caerostris extrusa]|uniref:Maturase K n=1 Tax=Caerostris extrusa TaxID=172846 RepID=A0AAV4X6V7_CAEEX|nr:hypothetical protein CEXT_551991 [Caerostris extrusa]
MLPFEKYCELLNIHQIMSAFRILSSADSFISGIALDNFENLLSKFLRREPSHRIWLNSLMVTFLRIFRLHFLLGLQEMSPFANRLVLKFLKDEYQEFLIKELSDLPDRGKTVDAFPTHPAANARSGNHVRFHSWNSWAPAGLFDLKGVIGVEAMAPIIEHLCSQRKVACVEACVVGSLGYGMSPTTVLDKRMPPLMRPLFCMEVGGPETFILST